MKIISKAVTMAVMAVFLAASGWIDAAGAGTVGSGNTEGGQLVETLAILPFENNSVTDPERYAPLSKGLSAMLITDLNKNAPSMKLIERGKIAALLKEVALSQSGAVDDSTAVQAGKVLGAQCIAFGSFMVIGKQVRIDTRIIKVETSALVMAESISGKCNDFMTLEQDLAKKIADSFNVGLNTKDMKAGSDIEAALYFSEGLDLLDKGDKAGAQKMFKECIKLDPAYKTQVDNAQGQKL